MVGRALLVASAVLLALALGFGGLSLLFSDLGPGETERSRLVTVAAYYLVAGAISGLLQPRRWWLAVLIGWGGLLLGLVVVLTALGSGPGSLPAALALLLGPSGLALAGAAACARLRALAQGWWRRRA